MLLTSLEPLVRQISTWVRRMFHHVSPLAVEKRHARRNHSQNRSPCLCQIRSFRFVVISFCCCTGTQNDYSIIIFTFTKIIISMYTTTLVTSKRWAMFLEHLHFCFFFVSSLEFSIFKINKSFHIECELDHLFRRSFVNLAKLALINGNQLHIHFGIHNKFSLWFTAYTWLALSNDRYDSFFETKRMYFFWTIFFL